jgi:hypothetical protein
MGSSKPDNVEVEYLLGIIKEQLFDPMVSICLHPKWNMN